MKGQKRANDVTNYIKRKFPKAKIQSLELNYYCDEICVHIKNVDKDVSCFITFSLKSKSLKVTRIYDCLYHLSYYENDEIETELNIMEKDLK